MGVDYFLIFIVSLCIGSFLNVLIYRVPREQSIILPSSQCPFCNTPLKWIHNIPLFSYLFLKGKCYFCKKPISIKYPLVEILTACMGTFLFWQFGLTLAFVASSFFSVILIALIFIDLEHQLLPDILTLTLLWGGLLQSVLPIFANSSQAILGAAVGYSSFWLIAKLYEHFRGHEGMGYGDFKLLAAIGAWVGINSLIEVVLLSSLAGTVVGLSLLATKKVNAKTPIPFGPFLAVAGWVILAFHFRLLLLI